MTKVTSIFTKKNPASTFGRLGVGSVFGRVNQASTFTEGGVDYVAQTVYYFVTEDGLNYIITEDDKYIIKE
jgi:hypothetical protein